MSCDACKEALEIDGVEPPCFNNESEFPLSKGGKRGLLPGVNACWIPPLDAAGQRIMEMRSKLIALHDLIDSGTILKMYGANMEDIEMLAFVEEEIKKLQPTNPSPLRGEG